MRLSHEQVQVKASLSSRSIVALNDVHLPPGMVAVLAETPLFSRRRHAILGVAAGVAVLLLAVRGLAGVRGLGLQLCGWGES